MRLKWLVLAAVAGVLLVLGAGYIHGPTSGEIRVDTGDLRYCWWGIPLRHERMPEPYRSKLLALGSKSPAIPAEWVTCVTYPLPTSNNSDRMCQEFYLSVAIWVDEDPKIARWALDDLVNYMRGRARHGLPDSYRVLSGFVVDGGGRRINADWRDQDEVKEYLSAHGYTPPAATPGSRPK